MRRKTTCSSVLFSERCELNCVCLFLHICFLQKKKFAYNARRNWLSRVILKTVSNIIHHWDYDKCKERMTRPSATSTNPVVEKSHAVVLCLHCFGDNSERFTFCQHCGVANAIQPKGSTPDRIFGSEGTFQFSPRIREAIESKFAHFLAYKAASHNSKAICSVMKSFEKFLFSFGLARHAKSKGVRRAFTVLEASDSDVVNFCIWKSLSGVGRTYLHDFRCPLLGENKFNNKCVALGCERMIAAEYLRAGIISKLREGFRSIGLNSNWDEQQNCGNPALSRQVSRYYKMVQEQQAKAGVSQRQAAILLRKELQVFLGWMAVCLLSPEFQDNVSQFEIRMLRSLVTNGFASSKRCDDLCWILTRKIFRIPNSGGLIINFQFGKTLRQLPNHVFGLAPLDSGDPWYCPVLLMEDYVRFGFSIGVDMSVGFLYTKIDGFGARSIEKLSSAHVNARFRFFLDRVGMDNNNQGDLKLSIHSLRAGSAITKVLEGQSLKKVMYDAYWKNPATAWKYLKLFQVLFPFKDFGVQLSALSPEDYSLFNSTPLTQQSNWLQAFPGGGSMFDQSEFLLDALSESIGSVGQCG